MFIKINNIPVIFFLVLCVMSCKHNKIEELEPDLMRQIFFGNAIYHWKNTFNPTDEELRFLKNHKIRRIYLRFFDVTENIGSNYAAVPSATVVFAKPVPEGVEVVPTVFITTEAMERMGIATDLYANKLRQRILAMAKTNGVKGVREVQLDCDWTSRTEKDYFALCSAMRKIFCKDSIIVSATIRLHQLRLEAPPVDCGVLMLYNTANVKDMSQSNSILTYEDVKPYLKKKVDYALPLSFSYPVFGWDVLFSYNSFQRLCSIPDSIFKDTTCFYHLYGNWYQAMKNIPQLQINYYDQIRHERVSVDEVFFSC